MNSLAGIVDSGIVGRFIQSLMARPLPHFISSFLIGNVSVGVAWFEKTEVVVRWFSYFFGGMSFMMATIAACIGLYAKYKYGIKPRESEGIGKPISKKHDAS